MWLVGVSLRYEHCTVFCHASQTASFFRLVSVTPQRKTNNKKPHITDTSEEETDVDTDHKESDMSLQELLSNINKWLDNVATKKDISEMKCELQLLTQTFTDRKT